MPDALGSSPTPRVLLVLAHSEGGIGRHVRFLADRLPELGIAVMVCAPAETLDGLGLSESSGGVAAPIGQRGVRARWRVRRVLCSTASEVDVVHAHGLRAAADCAAALRGRPLVATWHNATAGSRGRRMFHAALARFVARSSALTLAASGDLAAAARRAGAAVVRDAFVVAPTLPAPQRTRQQVRDELAVGDRPLIVAVGRLNDQKRLDVLVAAAVGWAPWTVGRGEPSPDPVVVIAGEGPARAALTAQIEATAAPVRLLGARDDVSDLLGAADVIALPSQWEARSLVAQEALRAGVPLVTTPVGGLPALVGDAAILVAVGDAGGLRAALRAVVADHGLRDQLVALGLAQASTWPDEATCLAALVEIYIDLNQRMRL